MLHYIQQKLLVAIVIMVFDTTQLVMSQPINLIPITPENAAALESLMDLPASLDVSSVNYQVARISVNYEGNLIGIVYRDTKVPPLRMSIVQIWDINTSSLMYQEQVESAVSEIWFIRQSTQIMFDIGNQLTAIDLGSQEITQVWEINPNQTVAIKTNSTGTLMTFRNQENDLVLWDLDSNAELWSTNGIAVSAPVLDKDGTNLAVFSLTDEPSVWTVSVWGIDGVQANNILTSDINIDLVTSVQFSQDSSHLLINGIATATVLNLNDPNIVHSVPLSNKAMILGFRDWGQVTLRSEGETSVFYDTVSQIYLATFPNSDSERFFGLTPNETLSIFYDRGNGNLILWNVSSGESVTQVSLRLPAGEQPSGVLVSLSDTVIITHDILSEIVVWGVID